MRLVLQELIETEAKDQIGADRYERSELRSTERNGHRPRLLATQAGDVRNQSSQVTSMAVVVGTGIRGDGDREILGCDIRRL